jgi:hypothetical protein
MPRSDEARHAYNVRRRVRRWSDKIDPRLSVDERDGELFDGPAIEVLYQRIDVRDGVPYATHDDSIPEDEQRDKLSALFRLLTQKGLPVKYADRDSGAHFPCLEIALDEEYHNRLMATIARGAYEHGAEAMRPLVKHLGLHI